MNNHTTVYIGMDVHKESFTLSSFVLGEEEPKHVQTIPADYILVLKYTTTCCSAAKRPMSQKQPSQGNSPALSGE